MLSFFSAAETVVNSGGKVVRKKRATSSPKSNPKPKKNPKEAQDDEKEEDSKMPAVAVESYLCPITLELPWDPVTASDGRVYERTAILEYIKSQRKNGKEVRSPLTNLPMTQKLIPNPTFRSMVEELVSKGVLVGEEAEAFRRKVSSVDKIEKCRRLSERLEKIWGDLVRPSVLDPIHPLEAMDLREAGGGICLELAEFYLGSEFAVFSGGVQTEADAFKTGVRYLSVGHSLYCCPECSLRLSEVYSSGLSSLGEVVVRKNRTRAMYLLMHVLGRPEGVGEHLRKLASERIQGLLHTCLNFAPSYEKMWLSRDVSLLDGYARGVAGFPMSADHESFDAGIASSIFPCIHWVQPEE
jgi:hypothetical protein